MIINNDISTIFQSLALFIGALCHDLDHRGKNNKFMLDSESPLATIYSTSTMEHHHFNQTVTILQQVKIYSICKCFHQIMEAEFFRKVIIFSVNYRATTTSKF